MYIFIYMYNIIHTYITTIGKNVIGDYFTDLQQIMLKISKFFLQVFTPPYMYMYIRKCRSPSVLIVFNFMFNFVVSIL
jgi:hypothetical protein